MVGGAQRRKEKDEAPYGFVLVKCVSRMVDTDPGLFKRDIAYMSHAVEQVRQFFERLPKWYIGRHFSEQRFPKEKSAIFSGIGSPYELTIGFHPAYSVLLIADGYISNTSDAFRGSDYVAYPVFDVGFKPTDEEGARRILQAGLDQFFLLQPDDDKESLAVAGIRDRQTVRSGLEVLVEFLPRGTVIHARCDSLSSNGRAMYRL